MAENLTVNAPDFDQIRKETRSLSLEQTLRSIWLILNNELQQRRRTVRAVKEQIEGKVLSSAPASNQNNFDTQGALVVLFTGSTNFDLTGLRNGVEGQVKILANVGTAIITVKNNSGSSDALNRFRTGSGADVSLTQDRDVVVTYLNSLWRELKLV